MGRVANRELTHLSSNFSTASVLADNQPDHVSADSSAAEQCKSLTAALTSSRPRTMHSVEHLQTDEISKVVLTSQALQSNLSTHILKTGQIGATCNV